MNHQWVAGYNLKIFIQTQRSRACVRAFVPLRGKWSGFAIYLNSAYFVFKSHATLTKPTVNVDKHRGTSCLWTRTVTLATWRVVLRYVEAWTCCCLRFTTDKRSKAACRRERCWVGRLRNMGQRLGSYSVHKMPNDVIIYLLCFLPHLFPM